MEQELFEGLHKNRRWALEAVCQENLCRSWYLSYQLAGDAAGAASLLLSAWREALAALKNAKEAPGEDFQGLLSQKLLAQYQQGVQPDTRFENLPPPKVGESYQYLVGEVKRLPAALRPLYWLYAYGGLDASQLAAVTGEDSEALAQRLSQGEEQLALPVKPPKERPKKPWTTKRLTVLGIAVGVAALAVAAAVLAFVLLL